MKYDKTSAIWLIILRTALLFVALMLEGCHTSERVITVPEYHTVVAHQRDTLIRTDSIYIHDSVAAELRADTLYITRTRTEFRDRWRDRVRIDSFVQHDSVPFPVEVPTPLTRWQTWSLRTGDVELAAPRPCLRPGRALAVRTPAAPARLPTMILLSLSKP